MEKAEANKQSAAKRDLGCNNGIALQPAEVVV
jgi:hypothetical protein